QGDEERHAPLTRGLRDAGRAGVVGDELAVGLGQAHALAVGAAGQLVERRGREIRQDEDVPLCGGCASVGTEPVVARADVPPATGTAALPDWKRGHRVSPPRSLDRYGTIPLRR